VPRWIERMYGMKIAIVATIAIALRISLTVIWVAGSDIPSTPRVARPR
jgi:hypothetical protein